MKMTPRTLSPDHPPIATAKSGIAIFVYLIIFTLLNACGQFCRMQNYL